MSLRMTGSEWIIRRSSESNCALSTFMRASVPPPFGVSPENGRHGTRKRLTILYHLCILWGKVAQMTKLEIAMDELKRIDKEVESLQSERALWAGVVARERATTSPTLPGLQLIAQNSTPAGRSADYGAKTNTVRRFIAGRGDTGASMKDLKALAKQISGTANFIYRLIGRLKDAAEIIERNGRFIATDKLKQKVAA